jgi:hypothetical protein
VFESLLSADWISRAAKIFLAKQTPFDR